MISELVISPFRDSVSGFNFVNFPPFRDVDRLDVEPPPKRPIKICSEHFSDIFFYIVSIFLSFLFFFFAN